MSQQRLEVREVYRALLRTRGLEGPTGKPLYEYRFTREEFDDVATALRASAPTFLNNPTGRALFVVFVAEWFKREREAGHWDWVNPLAALGVWYHGTHHSALVRYPEVRAAAEAGLSAWRRRVPPGVGMLCAVIAESGFPAASVRQESGLATWLTKSVLAMEAGYSPEDAVRGEAWRAAETLVQALLEPAVALCRSIASLRSGLAKVDGPEDPVARLDLTRPSWRSELPFDLEERDVRRLVETLVRTQARNAVALTATRWLRRSEAGWSASVSLGLNGELDVGSVPVSVRRALNEARRLRVRPTGALSGLGRSLAALEHTEDESKYVTWEIRQLVESFDAGLRLDEDLRLEFLVGDRRVAEMVAVGGEALTGPVAVLRPPSNGQSAPEEALELEFLGVSPARSTAPWLALAVEENLASRVAFERDPVDLGSFGEPRRRLLAFRGIASLKVDGEELVWRSGDATTRAYRLRLAGDTVAGVDEEVFLGRPRAWLVDGDRAQSVTPDRLLWRGRGARTWTAVSRAAPLGAIDFAVRDGGELVAWTRAVVVPPAFSVIADRKAVALRLSGLAEAKVAALDGKVAVTSQDAAIVDLRDHPRGSPVRLGLWWDTPVALTMPDPLTDPVLLDPAGRPVRRARLCVGSLAGYRLLSPTPSSVLLEVRARTPCNAHARRTIEGTVSLSGFDELLRQLLGAIADLDARVRLSWAGQSDWSAEVGWYELEAPRTSDAPQEAGSAAPSLVAFSLSTPGYGVVAFAPSEPATTERLAERIGVGPWLLAGIDASGRRLRPKLVLDQAGATAGPLAEACGMPSQAARDAALDERLGGSSASTVDELRFFVDLCVAANAADVPYASLDVLRALCRWPGRAVQALVECASLDERRAVLRIQAEFPFLWCTIPVAEWISAYAARRARLVAKFEGMDEPASIATANIANALAQIVDLQPALRVHAQAVLIIGELAGRCDRSTEERIRRLPDQGLVELAQDLVRRHGDTADPPRDLGLARLAPRHAALVGRFDGSFADIVAAPLVAAALAVGDLNTHACVTACRDAWIFDRTYFEGAFACALLQRANSMPASAA